MGGDEDAWERAGRTANGRQNSKWPSQEWEMGATRGERQEEGKAEGMRLRELARVRRACWGARGTWRDGQNGKREGEGE